jgi:Lar family restriction alleviation protein
MKEQKLNNPQEQQCNIHDVVCALPCPFCGSETEIETKTFGDSMTDYFRVNCKQKGHSLDWWSDTESEAISVWNERQ